MAREADSSGAAATQTDPSRAGRRTIDPAGARARLMDAAECLLSQRGYHGASMREIAAEAGVPIGNMTYHFPSKEALFDAVVSRRAAEYVRRTEDALALAMRDPQMSVEDVLRAYLHPGLYLSAQGGPGWKNYMKMLAIAMNLRQQERFLAPVLELFDPLLRRVFAALQRACPGVPEDAMQWAFLFLSGAYVHVLTEAGLSDRQSDGRYPSSDLAAIEAHMIPFFASAFRGLKAG